MSEPLVSVIVPVRNGVEEVRALVDRLRAQTLPRDRFELIIADDGSTDGVGDLEDDPEGWLRVLHGPPVNSYAARNRAAAAARGSLFAFCDVDCRPEPEWLESGAARLQAADLVGGRIRAILPEHPTVWTFFDIEHYLDQERSVRDGHAVTANLFVRREVFERGGGFDDSLPSGGDFDFVSRCIAQGAKLVFAPDAVVGHPTRDRARSFMRKVWLVNRCYAARQRRLGRRPAGLKLRYWIPLVGPVRARVRGRPLVFDHRRLETHGARPGFVDHVRAVPLLYFVLPYLRNASHVHGWRQASRTG